MTRKYGCPTTGCNIELCHASAIDKHIKLNHDACSCGWAGVRFKAHVNSQARRREEGRRDPGEGTHERISMEVDADGIWRRVSTPGGVK